MEVLGEIYTYKHTHGEVTYKRAPSGIYYNAETAPEIVALLERLRVNGTRIRLHYGDVKTGRDWMDRYDVTGTLSNSMGPLKVPILIHNRRSMGGASILSHCIVKIEYSKACGSVIYRHPTYHETKEETNAV